MMITTIIFSYDGDNEDDDGDDDDEGFLLPVMVYRPNRVMILFFIDVLDNGLAPTVRRAIICTNDLTFIFSTILYSFIGHMAPCVGCHVSLHGYCIRSPINNTTAICLHIALFQWPVTSFTNKD